MSNTIKNSSLVILILINVIGVIGFSTPTLLPLFKSLTPYNLVLTVVLCFFHLPFKKFVTPFIILFILGYLVEFLGVKTGLLFGEYSYGEALGFQLMHVPIIIGVNWFILAIGARGCANYLSEKPAIQTLIAALLMVGLDILIEPVAIKFEFWTWAQADVPLQNYVMWLVVSLIMQLILTKTAYLIYNRLGFVILLSQTIFFAFLQVI